MKRRKNSVFYILTHFCVFFTFLNSVHLKPFKTGRENFLDQNVQNYLTTFGYLPQSNIETGELRTEESVRDALRELQRFANVPVTGKMDEKTRALLVRPRCGVPDVPQGAWTARQMPYNRRRLKRYTLQGLKWDHTNLTWSLRTKHFDGDLRYHAVRRELARALDVWAQNSKLTFRELDSDNADIIVQFEKGFHGDGYPFDGRGQILAHAFFPNSGRGGDAHFDRDEIWLTEDNADAAEGTSLFLVAAHEFGHSLGLSHSSVEDALMFPWYKGNLSKNFQLPEDDRHGIQQMYGAPERKMWDRRPEYVPQTTPTTTTTTTTTRRPYYPNRRYHPKDPYGKHHPPKYPNYYPNKTHPRHGHTTERPVRRWWWTTTTTSTTSTTTTTTSTRRPPEYPKGPPETCDTSYDAISVIRRETFIFKDQWLWRIGEGGLMANYPVEITRMWKGLPSDLERVDAVYERHDGKIIFFIGRYVYAHDGRDVVRGYPVTLQSMGLPETLDHVDAALVWGHNGKTYLYSGTMYWRLDDETNKVEPDYPRDMSMWRGIGYNIDTAFQWKDGKTYFFKGKGYWRFNDLRMAVEHEDQKPSAQFWMGCPKKKFSERSNELSPEKDKLTAERNDLDFKIATSKASKSLLNNLPILIIFMWLTVLIRHCV